MLRDRPPRIQEIIIPILQRNSFWADLENIFLCQIHVHDYSIRQDSKVIRSRENAKNEQESELRKFIPPKVDFNASSYYTMVEYGENATPPPLLSEYMDDQLRSHIDTSRIIQIPCHTQAVERGVKLVTE